MDRYCKVSFFSPHVNLRENTTLFAKMKMTGKRFSNMCSEEFAGKNYSFVFEIDTLLLSNFAELMDVGHLSIFSETYFRQQECASVGKCCRLRE